MSRTIWAFGLAFAALAMFVVLMWVTAPAQPALLALPTPIPLLPTSTPLPPPTPTPSPTPPPGAGVLRSPFGVEIWRGHVAVEAELAAAAGVGYVRYDLLWWDRVEVQPGVYVWPERESREVALLTAHGLTPIAVIHNAPRWARLVVDSGCGPVHPDALHTFGDFLSAAVSHYSQPPYQVRHYEIWNEPDAPLVPEEKGWGCWGRPEEPNWGGEAYADLLKVAYPAVKAANPEAVVLMGGLLLGCPQDPSGLGSCADHSGRFLHGVLANGGGDYFDILPYHVYSYHGRVTGRDWTMGNQDWLELGGLLAGKAAYVRQILAQYGHDEKPLMMGEGALLCVPTSPHCPGEEFFQAQANYLLRLYVRCFALRLEACIWYSLTGPGWREAGLLDERAQPRAAYQTLRYLTGLLGDAEYSRSLATGLVEGHELRDRSSGQRYRFYWLNYPLSYPDELPQGSLDLSGAAFDKFGSPVDPVIGYEPVVIQVAP